MSNEILYWMGVAVAFCGGLIVLGALFLLAGWFAALAAAYMLRKGLHIIRLSNWRYWNERMHKEGLICMQKFYIEQVAIHKPKSLEDFSNLDQAATRHEQGWGEPRKVDDGRTQ
jgi:hypothetical protein